MPLRCASPTPGVGNATLTGNHAGRRGYSHSRCHCYSRAGWHRYSHSGCHRYSNRARCHRYYHAAATPAASDMAKVQTNMTENMAGMDAADAGMKTHMDTVKAGMKSDMEMKHSMIAQMQVMSDQIKELNERVTALSAKLETPAKPVKAAKAAKPAVRAPIKPVY
jgi:outer membrane murein-binding lipoprotein Lpp